MTVFEIIGIAFGSSCLIASRVIVFFGFRKGLVRFFQ